MEAIQILLSADEKQLFADISKKMGFYKSQLGLVLLYSLVEMYKKRGSFIIVDLEIQRFNSSTRRDKRIQIICPDELKKEIERINEELGFSKTHLGFIAIQTFIASYKKSGTNMFSEILCPMYRTGKF